MGLIVSRLQLGTNEDFVFTLLTLKARVEKQVLRILHSTLASESIASIHGCLSFLLPMAVWQQHLDTFSRNFTSTLRFSEEILPEMPFVPLWWVDHKQQVLWWWPEAMDHHTLLSTSYPKPLTNFSWNRSPGFTQGLKTSSGRVCCLCPCVYFLTNIPDAEWLWHSGGLP